VQGIVLVLIFSLFAPTVSLKPLSIETPSVLAANRSVKTIASGTKYATSLYVIKSGVRGPVVMVVGGTHGNEPAGYKAAHLIKNYSVKNGTLLVIPEANRIAVQNKTRTAPGVGDLNRSFPKTSSDKPDDPLARAIVSII
jgi:predicted deacylase